MCWRSFLAAVFLAAPVFADDVPSSYDVYILGEVHDNPAHHAWQAEQIARLAPKAVVFEMLLPSEAAALEEVARAQDTMNSATQGFVWENLALYGDVFANSDQIVGAAVPAEKVRAAFADGAAVVFGKDAKTYGLTQPLPPKQQVDREEMQFTAHCEAMPRHMMSGMVEAQRLRDAAFARAVLEAVDLYGSPVVLITGNGHARTDHGVPAYIGHVRPSLTVWSAGQGEETAPDGDFDQLVAAPGVARGDPCAAFR